jgi:hypothetical protein
MYTVKHNSPKNKINAIVAKVQINLEEEERNSKKKKEKLAKEKLEQYQIMQNNYSYSGDTSCQYDYSVNSNYGLSSSSFASGYKSNGMILYKW